MEDRGFELTLDLQKNYRFVVDFDREGVPPLLMDEPQPLGDDRGPNATRLVAAAVGNCLSASALFCLRKARVPVSGMQTRVRMALTRNEEGRLRIGGIDVEIHPVVASADLARAGRCLDLFEDFCIVTQSVRAGVDVTVDVRPPAVAPGSGS